MISHGGSVRNEWPAPLLHDEQFLALLASQNLRKPLAATNIGFLAFPTGQLLACDEAEKHFFLPLAELLLDGRRHQFRDFRSGNTEPVEVVCRSGQRHLEIAVRKSSCGASSP